jgi:putative MATE family efflux protein
MLQNIIGGLQGIIDHTLVGHFVGYTGNAAIGVSLQIYILVIVFVSSMYSGMGVLVSRFAGAGDVDKVNRTVYQAFLTSIVLSVGVLAPIGYFLSPPLLRLVNATPEVQAAALPFLRIMFMFSFGMLVFFMLGGALRSAGDARTPLRLGIAMTGLNIGLNLILIPGLGPIPALGTAGSAIGTSIATGSMGLFALYKLRRGSWVVSFPRGMSLKPDWPVIRSLFRFGLPTGVQGTAMNIAGLMLLRFIGSLQQSAQAQAAFAVCYSQLFSFITWTSFGLMGATAAVVGQNLGAHKPERAQRAVVDAARIGVTVALIVGVSFLLMPRILLGVFGLTDPVVTDIGVNLLRFLSISGFFITVALTYTVGCRALVIRGAHSTSRSYRRSCAPRHLLFPGEHRETATERHLAGDPDRTLHALHAERHALPAGQVAAHRGRYRAAQAGIESLQARLRQRLLILPQHPGCEAPSIF